MNLTKRLPFAAIEVNPLFDGDKSSYPALAARFAVLEAEVEPAFEALDRRALHAQRRHRRIRLGLIVLAFVATVLGAIEATSGNERWAGAAVLIVSGIATVVSRIEAEDTPGVTYLRERARAEELRSLYFRFLAGEDDGAPEAEWANWLAGRVAAVEHATVEGGAG